MTSPTSWASSPDEFRLKNLDPNDFHTPIYEAELKMGSELIGWREKRKPRGQTGTGPIRHGMGVGLHQWGGGGTRDKKVSCTINPDGSVELRSAMKTSALVLARSWRSSRRRFSDSSQLISYRISAIRPSRRGIGGFDHDALDVPAVSRRGYEGT